MISSQQQNTLLSAITFAIFIDCYLRLAKLAAVFVWINRFLFWKESKVEGSPLIHNITFFERRLLFDIVSNDSFCLTPLRSLLMKIIYFQHPSQHVLKKESNIFVKK